MVRAKVCTFRKLFHTDIIKVVLRKISRSGGHGFRILQVEAYLDGISGEIPLAVRERIGRTVDHAAGRNRYTGYLISLATRSYKNMKVGLDCANGSAWMIAKSVFDALGASTYVINNEPDGTNINRDCGSTISRDCRHL